MAKPEFCESLELSSSESKLARKSNFSSINKVCSKNRRGYGRKKVKFACNSQAFTVVGTNAAGLNSKKESLLSLVNTLKPSVLTIQETKCLYYRSIKIPGYEIIEHLRKDKLGGGLLTAARVELNPHQVAAYDDAELLVVQVEVNELKIRIINGYGPQEDDEDLRIIAFWKALEIEIINAKDEHCLVIVELDANAKIGKEHIKNDPNLTSNNGQLLLDLVQRQGLCIGNALPTCKGVITREKKVKDKIERSVIDYFIFCDAIVDFLDEIIIDEDREFVLRHATKKKGANNVITSDHNILFSRFSINFTLKRPSIRYEFFNFKCNEGRKMFLNETNVSNNLTSCFTGGKDFEFSCSSFLKQLNSKFHKCFTKIRIKKVGNILCGNKYLQKRILALKEIKTLKQTTQCATSLMMLNHIIKKIEIQIDEAIAHKKLDKVTEYVNSCKTDEGRLDQTGFWRLKKKLCPPERDPPMAKRDLDGNIITAPEALKTLYLTTYSDRLKHRKMKPELQDIFDLKTRLWEMQLYLLERNNSKDWTTQCLEKALSSLKSNKTMDPNGMPNEIFKKDAIGSDLKNALLYLYNGCREHQYIPSFMSLSNVTSIYKNKGSRLLIENDRGIFIQTVFKKILDKMIYSETYDSINDSMSDSNIGARKGKNIRDVTIYSFSTKS